VYTDRNITCQDCGNEFSFTAGEQEFYAQRGFTEPPKRCATCRTARKAARSQSGEGAAFNSGSAAYDNGERRPREMFEAVCADCGNTTTVPFRPSGIKPVYCRDCFGARR
jgi:CxxC-x17-CxxC domain-containing protein